MRVSPLHWISLLAVLITHSAFATPDDDLLLLLKQKDKTYAQVEALLQQGASARARSGLSWTALMYGIDNAQITELLLKRGAEINATNKAGRTALMYAASFGYTETVKVLLKHGADTTIQDKYGNTALALAESRGKNEAAALLRAATPPKPLSSVVHTQPVGGDGLEAAIVAELNLVRSNPRKYADFLRQHLAGMRDGVYQDDAGRNIATKEGSSAVREAIAALEAASPVTPLQNSALLAKAAADHAGDLGRSGGYGHTGSDGSTPEQRIMRHGQWQKTCAENITYGIGSARAIVMALIIDDGVSSRGHRKNILHPDFGVVGTACANHSGRSPVCVMDFAGGMQAK